ncbi:phosphodiester glycosidase family protein [bacterium]|nr:phosphodiester glycosidase family protein [bacterium]
MAAAILMHVCLAAAPLRADETVRWQVLEPGLEYAEVASPIRSEDGDSQIRIARIDPTRFSVELFNASATPDGTRRTVREWAEQRHLAAAINAGLYQDDYRTSTSLMRSREHVNNPRLSRHNAVLLFDRREAALPPVQLIDRTCRDLGSVVDRYAGAVQGIRMISCKRANVWTQQDKQWSNAAVGVDEAGRLLFIHMRAPLSTHDFAEALLALPIGLRETMYVEGGPEAQLFVRGGGREIEALGSHGSSGFAALAGSFALPVPNVLGVRRTQ